MLNISLLMTDQTDQLIGVVLEMKYTDMPVSKK